MMHLVHERLVKKPIETYLSKAIGFFWGESPVLCVIIDVAGTQIPKHLKCNESKMLSEVLCFECENFVQNKK